MEQNQNPVVMPNIEQNQNSPVMPNIEQRPMINPAAQAASVAGATLNPDASQVEVAEPAQNSTLPQTQSVSFSDPLVEESLNTEQDSFNMATSNMQAIAGKKKKTSKSTLILLCAVAGLVIIALVMVLMMMLNGMM